MIIIQFKCIYKQYIYILHTLTTDITIITSKATLQNLYTGQNKTQ